MRQWSGPQNAGDLAGWYGPDRQCYGIITDHLHLLDGEVLTIGGYRYALGPYDSKHTPVLCSEIIRVNTEDGPSDGRCGLPVLTGAYACEGHTEERRQYADDLYPDDFEGYI